MSDGSPPPLDAQALRSEAEYQLAHPEEYHTAPASTILALLARVDDLERERDSRQRQLSELIRAARHEQVRANAAEAEVARLRTALSDGGRFLVIFDSVMADENDGTRRIYSDTDLHVAATKFRAALSGGAAQ